mgnify:CR=1 FL=1
MKKEFVVCICRDLHDGFFYGMWLMMTIQVLPVTGKICRKRTRVRAFIW